MYLKSIVYKFSRSLIEESNLWRNFHGDYDTMDLYILKEDPFPNPWSSSYLMITMTCDDELMINMVERPPSEKSKSKKELIWDCDSLCQIRAILVRHISPQTAIVNEIIMYVRRGRMWKRRRWKVWGCENRATVEMLLVTDSSQEHRRPGLKRGLSSF